jgi:cation diffusion facilitator family transporter
VAGGGKDDRQMGGLARTFAAWGAGDDGKGAWSSRDGRVFGLGGQEHHGELHGHEPHGGHSHDSDGHQHDQRPDVVARLRHLLVPHSHDTADRVDRALETSRRGLRCLAVSFVALLVTAALQLVVVLVSGSVALLGDTLHNAADALTAVPLAIAFTVGRRAATRSYTYGFGRAEDLAGVVIVLLIAASAVAAGYQAIDRLLNPRPVEYLAWVAAAGVIGFAGNEAVARYRITVGRQIGSAALVADGLHARTDGFTSLAVVLGAGGVAAGIPEADPVVGLLIAVAIVAVLRDAARQVYRRLMDAVDPELVDQADAAVAATPGVREVGELRLRWIGHSIRAEVSVLIDPAVTLGEAHAIAHAAEHQLLHEVPRLTAAHVHAEPLGHAATEVHDQLAHHR